MDFLLLFAGQEFEDFREAEVTSLLDINQIDFDKSELENHNWRDNFLVVNFNSYDDVKKLISRSILIKCAYRIWAQDKSVESLCQKIASFSDDFTKKMNEDKLTYRLNVEHMHKKCKSTEKLQLIEMVLGAHKQLNMTELQLNNPDVELGLIVDYPYNKEKGRVTASQPSNVYYGELVSYSQRLRIANKYRMSERKFIGNTSMDVKLSFLMANLGRVTANQLVLDPFVGTGSILVAAAHFGAFVCGTDIDYKVVYGLGKSTRADEIWRAEGECLRLNFQQYEMESRYIDVFVGDSSRLDKILRPDFRFDAILTDPPYGIRERGRKLMSRENRPYMHDKNVPHFPMKESYQMTSVFDDLLALSATRLQLGGYLVMWIPLVRAQYTGVESLPQHPALQLVHNCEQVLNERTSRRLLVFRKVAATSNGVVAAPASFNTQSKTLREMYFNAK